MSFPNLVALTDIQKQFLTRICILLVIQLFIMIAIVLGLHELVPNKTCLITCNIWIDLVLFIILEILLLGGLFLFRDYKSPAQFAARCGFFFAFGSLLSYVIAVQYNIMMETAKDKEQTQKNFFIAIGITLGIFITVLIAIPLLLSYVQVLYTLLGFLMVFLIAILIWTILIGISYTYLVFALILFILFLIVDVNLLTYECKKKNTRECDAPTGASKIFIDLINIIQKIFMLLDFNNR